MHCKCLLLALSRHPMSTAGCPLLGVKRTSQFEPPCPLLTHNGHRPASHVAVAKLICLSPTSFHLRGTVLRYAKFVERELNHLQLRCSRIADTCNTRLLIPSYGHPSLFDIRRRPTYTSDIGCRGISLPTRLFPIPWALDRIAMNTGRPAPRKGRSTAAHCPPRACTH